MAWLKLTDNASGKTLNTSNIVRIEPVKSADRGGSYIAVVGREVNYQVNESTDSILSRLNAMSENLG
jgi:hypothetical protein